MKRIVRRGGMFLLLSLLGLPPGVVAQDQSRQLDVEELAILVNRLREARTQCENETASLWKAFNAQARQVAELKKQVEEKGKVASQEPGKP